MHTPISLSHCWATQRWKIPAATENTPDARLLPILVVLTPKNPTEFEMDAPYEQASGNLANVNFCCISAQVLSQQASRTYNIRYISVEDRD